MYSLKENANKLKLFTKKKDERKEKRCLTENSIFCKKKNTSLTKAF